MGNLRRGMVDAMLTDLYQLTMAYSYWEHGRADEPCAFEMFYRKSPFGGEFSIFAGLREFLGYLREFGFGEEDVEVLREVMPGIDEGFFEWLKGCNASKLVVRAMKEGSVVFPGEPLVTVEGPLAVVQLVETTLLNLTNFSSLVCTNAVRHRIAAGPQAKLVEFGLRRAQGPNGGVTASVYSYVGGFDATSNVQAGKLFKIPLRGTHAHSFVQSYSGAFVHPNLRARFSYGKKISLTTILLLVGTALKTMGRTLRNVDGEDCDLVGCVLKYRERLGFTSTNDGELAAFIAFAQCFPSGFVALIDTYDPVLSGARNFILVALALFEFGYKPVGVRLDSGDLAALSVAVREEFQSAAGEANCEQLVHCQIMASNNINEDFLLSLKEKKHELTAFGIGTNLVTCQKQPALGKQRQVTSCIARERQRSMMLLLPPPL